MAREDNYRDNQNNSDDTFNQDETVDFERRQQSAKRESDRRARTAEKLARQEMEGELTRKSQVVDKRVLEKERKRHYKTLKKLADQLSLKKLLEDVSVCSAVNCWGPDVVSDKERPSLGIVLNYTTEPPLPPGADPANPPVPGLFGAWLYMSSGDTMIAVGVKTPTAEDTVTSHAHPPLQDQCSLTVSYNSAAHDAIQQQVKTALEQTGPLNN
jgi:hypothetical protein